MPATSAELTKQIIPPLIGFLLATMTFIEFRKLGNKNTPLLIFGLFAVIWTYGIYLLWAAIEATVNKCVGGNTILLFSVWALGLGIVWLGHFSEDN